MSERASVGVLYAQHWIGTHGLDGDECREFCSLSGEATHCPMGVNAKGEGPVMAWEPDYARTECWCERRGHCPINPPHVERLALT
jgi:hypothetical protein